MVILRRMGYESLRIDCNISYCVIYAMHGHLTVTLMSRSCICLFILADDSCINRAVWL